MPPKKKASFTQVEIISDDDFETKKKISRKTVSKPLGKSPFEVAAKRKHAGPKNKVKDPFSAAASSKSTKSPTITDASKTPQFKNKRTPESKSLVVDSDSEQDKGHDRDDDFILSPKKKKVSTDVSKFFSDEDEDEDFDPAGEKESDDDERTVRHTRRSTRNTPVKVVSKHFQEAKPKKATTESTVNPDDFFSKEKIKRATTSRMMSNANPRTTKVVALDDDNEEVVVAPVPSRRKRGLSPVTDKIPAASIGAIEESSLKSPVSARAPKRTKRAGVLAGKSFAVTGKLHTFTSLDVLREAIEEKEGQLQTGEGVFESVTHAVTGTEPTSTDVNSAIAGGVRIIDESELCRLLGMPIQAKKALKACKNFEKEKEKERVAERKMKVTSVKKIHKIDVMDIDEEDKVASAKKSGYQAMLSREPPKALGTRVIPVCKPGCFDGITFVVSGILETLTGDDLKKLLSQYGGKLTGAVSGKTTYLIQGRDGGQGKSEKANKLGVKILNENELYELLNSHKTLDQSSARAPHVVTKDEQAATDEARKSNFAKILSRAGPQQIGSRDVPNCKPRCLDGMTFVFSGILDSISIDDAQEVVKTYGGRCTGSVSGKTSYLVVGRDRGETKYKKAIEKNVKILDEDAWYALLSKHELKEGEEYELDPSPVKSTKKEIKPEDSWVPKRPKKSDSIHHAKIETSSGSLQSTGASSNARNSKEPNITDSSALLWTDKYKPTSVKEIIGNAVIVEKLTHWLQNWNNRHIKGMTIAASKTAGRGKPDDAHKKAVLLTGPPGIGKTTMATLIAKELGFDPIEMNASDTRSKSSLRSVVSSILTNKTMSEFYGTGSKDGGKSKKHCLIMDEVDGMSAGDRGGVAELNQLIKMTKVPIICMCNDNGTQKMRSLTPNCYDLKVSRPTPQAIKGKMMGICFKEGLKIEPNALDELIRGTQNDLRQILNQLSVWRLSGNRVTYASAKDNMKSCHKDMVTSMNAFECVRKVYDPESVRTMTLEDRLRHFFVDDIVPLMSQENYLSHIPQLSFQDVQGKPRGFQEAKEMHLASLAAESFSDSDMIDTVKRTHNAWGLMPQHGMASFVRPAFLMKGSFRSTGFGWSRIAFPSWLGNFSKTNKYHRQLKDLQLHTRVHGYNDTSEINQWYLPVLSQALTAPMEKEGMDGVPRVLEVMTEYTLLREDWDIVQDICTYKGITKPPHIETRTKSAFTRTYNKSNILLPYSEKTEKSKKVAASTNSGANELAGGDEGGFAQETVDADEVDSEDDVVVAKKSATVKKTSAKGKGKVTAKGKRKGKL
eukprot:CFRG3280T1